MVLGLFAVLLVAILLILMRLRVVGTALLLANLVFALGLFVYNILSATLP